MSDFIAIPKKSGLDMGWKKGDFNSFIPYVPICSSFGMPYEYINRQSWDLIGGRGEIGLCS
jgi:hypothetical protein